MTTNEVGSQEPSSDDVSRRKYVFANLFEEDVLYFFFKGCWFGQVFLVRRKENNTAQLAFQFPEEFKPYRRTVYKKIKEEKSIDSSRVVEITLDVLAIHCATKKDLCTLVIDCPGDVSVEQVEILEEEKKIEGLPNLVLTLTEKVALKKAKKAKEAKKAKKAGDFAVYIIPLEDLLEQPTA